MASLLLTRKYVFFFAELLGLRQRNLDELSPDARHTQAHSGALNLKGNFVIHNHLPIMRQCQVITYALSHGERPQGRFEIVHTGNGGTRTYLTTGINTTLHDHARLILQSHYSQR